MKRGMLLLACLTALAVRAAAYDVDLGGSWSFRFEENRSIEEVASETFVATDRMVVPGCYDAMPKWFLKRGTGLYRRTFTLDRAVDNAWLVVDGIGLRGDFRLDGKRLGVHPFPYARLEIPTGPLAAGEHTLFAALDNRFDWSTMKLARKYYDFYFYGGFYRGIGLSFDNRRLFVRTRDYKAGEVEVEVVGGKADAFEGVLTFDGQNEVKASFTNARARVKVPNFKLWSPEHPNLHTVAFVRADDPAATRLSARFGIRTVEARDRRIWLNGRPIFLKGVNRHDQSYEFGVCVSRQQMLRDLQIIKSLNANFVRGAHYQQSQEFLDLCDELGVLVWEESLGWGNGQAYNRQDKVDEFKDAAFADAQVRQTREMVRTSFNHPSVIIFAFLNECDGRRPDCQALVDRLIDTVREQDSGRLVTFACNQWKGDLCHARTDLVAFNTYPGTIPNQPGTPAELAEKVRNSPTQGFNVIARAFREKYPDKPIIVSESGVGAMYGWHDPAACLGSEEFQREYLTDICETVGANPDIVGFAVWQFADNRTFHRNSNDQAAKLFGISIAGLVDFQRRPKAAFEVVRKFFGAK